MDDDALPFGLTLIHNESAESTRVVSRRKAPRSAQASTESLNLAWPRGVISLSHIALPFPPDDPLYGRRGSSPDGALQLGQMDIQGERGLLRFSADWLLRLRHNPFYDFLESRVLGWMADTRGRELETRRRAAPPGAHPAS